MIFAQIKENIVCNVIVLDDMDLISHFAESLTYIINITDMIPQPGIGWSYDGENFTAPILVEE